MYVATMLYIKLDFHCCDNSVSFCKSSHILNIMSTYVYCIWDGVSMHAHSNYMSKMIKMACFACRKVTSHKKMRGRIQKMVRIQKR